MAAANGPAARQASARGRATGRRTQAERSALSDGRLLRAALELIAERGFRATSLEAIGKRAGYSRGLVSHRFGSKEGLLEVLVARMLERWDTTSREPAVGDRTGIDALQAAAGAHRSAIETHPSGIRALYMLIFEALGGVAGLRREFRRLDRKLRVGTQMWLEAGIETGTIRHDVDAAAMAAIYLGALRGITLQWLVDPKAFDLGKVYAELHTLLRHGLEP